jgi:hypothetical protein
MYKDPKFIQFYKLITKMYTDNFKETSTNVMYVMYVQGA